MTYVKNTWTPGDIITSEATAEKLNSLEDAISQGGGGGSGSSPFIPIEIVETEEDYHTTFTAQEAINNFKSGKFYYTYMENEFDGLFANGMLSGVLLDNGGYALWCSTINDIFRSSQNVPMIALTLNDVFSAEKMEDIEDMPSQ